MATRPGLLALDLATTSGWASYDGCDLRFGSETFSGGIGQFADGLMAWISQRLGPETDLFVEAPILRGRKTSVAAAMKLMGAHAVASMAAFRSGSRLTAVRPSEWRRHFIGTATAPVWLKPAQRRRWLKEAALRRCAEMGLSVSSDDAADAIGLLSFAFKERGLDPPWVDGCELPDRRLAA